METEQLVAIHKSHNGEIISFKTSNGRIISYRKALAETAEGKITGVHINNDEENNDYLTSVEGPALENFPPIY